MIVVLVADLLLPDREAWRTSSITALGLLGALIPIATLAHSGHERVLFGGAYVVGHYALALKAFFILAAYITVLLSVDYIGEGDYYNGEFYFLLLVAVFGMSIMSGARDLITLFVALETISIPTFVLAAFRKHDRASNEAGVKYYLIGVLSSALMLYGFSLIYGVTGATLLSGPHSISEYLSAHGTEPLVAVAIFLSLVGFAFKVSAVPFHFWAPDTYEGAPTPVTAFLSVASKAGGFVALINIIYFGFLTGERARGGELVVAGAVGPCRVVDDARQPHRAAPDEHRPHVGVFVGRAGRVHARAVRGGRDRRAPTVISRRRTPR